jgi:PEP-CTERM motif
MKIKYTLVAALMLVLPSASKASVTINFGLGTMYSGETTSSDFFAVGGRINLLALNSGTWSALPALLGYATLNEVFANQTSSFTPTGVTLVGSIGNDGSGGDGITGGAFQFDYSGNFGPGDELLAVGYSSLTTSSLAPGFGTKGFFFRTASIIDGSDIAWVAPADGFAYTLGAYTDPNGSLSAGALTSGNGAVGGNGFTTVPEPSTYALLAMGGLALGGYMIRRRRRA